MSLKLTLALSVTVSYTVASSSHFFLLITDEVLKKGIQDAATFAPLHNPAHLIGIKKRLNRTSLAYKTLLYLTPFHQTMPSQVLPIRSTVQPQHKEHPASDRYGMHGTSHLFITREVATRVY